MVFCGDRGSRAAAAREQFARICHPVGGHGPWFPQRESLESALRAATRRRICVVTGVAGWGKTTAVRQYGDCPRTAWVSHEAFGTGGFAATVRSALTDLFPHGASPLPTARRTDLLGWLHSAQLDEDVVLVVDDVQHAERGSRDARLLQDLCERAPEWLRVVLISRQALPFSLERLRGRGQVAEVDATRLALSASDVATVVRWELGEDPPGLADLVWRSTAGWPSAVSHVLAVMRDQSPARRAATVAGFARPGEPFHRYVLDEVLGEEPAEVADHLRYLAACEDHSGPVAECADWEVLLADMTRRGLLGPESEHGDWSLLPPLRAHFAHELRRSPGTRKAVHRTLSRHCRQHGAYSQALGHALVSGDASARSALLAHHGGALVHGGVVEDVQRVADIEASDVADGVVQRVVGQARQVRGQWAGALACFRRAGADQRELDPALAWRVGLLSYARGEFAEVLDVCGRVGQAQETSGDEARVLALAACTRRLVGDHEESTRLVERAEVAACRSGDAGAQAAAYIAAAMRAAAEGDLRCAEAYRAGAVEAAEAAGDVLQQLRMSVVALLHWVESRDPAGAVESADAAVGLGRSCGDVCWTALALTARGRAHLRVGRPELATVDFTQAVESLQRLGSRLLAWPLCGLGDVHRLQGRETRALTAYGRALALAEPCHDVLGMGAALIGSARVTACDDPEGARRSVERAVSLNEGVCAVQALITRGWLSLLDGNRAAAASDATSAVSTARARTEETALAEALMLQVLSSVDPARESHRLPELIQVWQDAGCQVEEAAARIVADRLSSSCPGPEVSRAQAFLRDCGVDVHTRRAAGPLRASAPQVPSVVVQTLGTFQVRLQGEVVPQAAWQSRKARELVKILVAHRRPVSREVLRELLWPEVEPGKSANRLSVLLCTVREVLQPQGKGEGGPVAGDGTAVWLDRAMVDIDVESFLTLARTALALHRSDGPDAMEALLAAERAWTGPFLEEDGDREWASGLAEEVRSTGWSVLRALAQRLEHLDDVDAAARYLVRLLDMDPYDECVHLDLVALFQRAGRFGAARRRHHVYSQRMIDIGVDPHPCPSGRAVVSQASEVPIPGPR